MKKIRKLYLIIAFLSIVFIISFKTTRAQYSEISQLENRSLAGMPVFTKEDFLSGNYLAGWDSFLTEQIYGRDKWIEGYIRLNKNILGKRNINDIVITQEGHLLPHIPHSKVHDFNELYDDLNTMTDNMAKIQEILDRHGGEFLFVGLPGQGSYFRDKMPKYYNNDEDYLNYNEKTMFDLLDSKKINHINMAEDFSYDKTFSNDQEYYFKTDHHYTFKGALETYQRIIDQSIDSLGLDSIRRPLKEEEMKIISLPNPILGSRNRSLAYIHPTDEYFQIAYPVDEIEYKKITNGGQDQDFYKVSDDPDHRPDYSIYMGGDFAEIQIQTDRPDLPNLLIFGDSFTNALEPLLYYHFNQTRILDLRYYSKTSLYTYIEDYKPDFLIMVRDDLHYADLSGNGKFD